jgi:H+/gluconate symporter-like permease
MDNGLKMVIGMSLAYITSFAGLLLAYFSYKKHHKNKKEGKKDE